MPWSASFAALTVALAACGSGTPKAVEHGAATTSKPSGSVQPQTAPATFERHAGAHYDEVGLASWYGEELGPNARASNGERFVPAAITIAHRTLPLGSFVEITALDTGRTIVARVTDRGPHRANRLIDMSRGAAQLLGSLGRSVAAVRVRDVTVAAEDEAALRAGRAASPRLDEPAQSLAMLRRRLTGMTDSGVAAPSFVSPGPADASRSSYLVQVGSFADRGRAQALADRFGGDARPAGGVWRVRLGPFVSPAAANRARDGATRRGYGDAVVVRQD